MSNRSSRKLDFIFGVLMVEFLVAFAWGIFKGVRILNLKTMDEALETIGEALHFWLGILVLGCASIIVAALATGGIFLLFSNRVDEELVEDIEESFKIRSFF